MRIRHQRTTTGLVTAIGAGVLVATAMTAPATAAPQPGSTGVQSSIVTTWINGNVRYGPSTDHDINYPVAAGFTSTGLCWKEGGWVSANGVSHNKWVKLGPEEWIWGGLLNGNETGGVSEQC
ncbi:hypothetical protein [Streptomyces sp. NPDC050504]|uniref:hypothetical protein n=1 Tax=Streptomyces sp. NPDC050504 TaxID=3365618 RepID=UPI0037A0A0BA